MDLIDLDESHSPDDRRSDHIDMERLINHKQRHDTPEKRARPGRSSTTPDSTRKGRAGERSTKQSGRVSMDADNTVYHEQSKINNTGQATKQSTGTAQQKDSGQLEYALKSNKPTRGQTQCPAKSSPKAYAQGRRQNLTPRRRLDMNEQDR